MARFQKRYDEGYDLYDVEYLRRLELNHPSDLPADRSLLVSTPSTPSKVDSFTSVELLLESSENGMCNPSKYLIQYVAASTTKNKPAKRVSGVRVLTSKECVKILKEREEK